MKYETAIEKLRCQKQSFEYLLEQQQQKIAFRFDPELEARFWKDRQDRIVKIIAKAVYAAIIFYFIFHCVSLTLNYLSADPLYRARDISRNHISFAGSWISLLTVFAIAKIPAWQYLYGKVVPFLVFFGISINATILLSMYSLPLAWRGTIIVTLIIVFVYIFSGLKPKVILVANICAAILIVSYFKLAEIKIAGWVLTNTLLLPNLVGMALAVLSAATEKIRFLQARIIELDKRIYELMSQQSLDLSQQDPLTLLGNRRGFEENLKHAMDETFLSKQALALLFIDVDYFKRYNDAYGHNQGDIALIAVAKTLLKHIEEGDIAIRFGGEEFVILLQNADCTRATHIAEAIIQDLCCQNIQHQQSDIASHLTVSIGFTVYQGEKAFDYAQLLKTADQALYMAKTQGRNRYHMLALDELLIQAADV